MTRKVLFVDDDPKILSAFKRGLRKQFELHTAEGGLEGLNKLDADGPFAVVVSDQQMPGMDGVAFLKSVRSQSPLATRIMLTGNADQTTAMHAVNEGAIFRFLTKPCDTDRLGSAISEALRQYQLLAAEKELLEQTLAGSVKVLVDVLSANAPEVFQKTGRVREWAKLAAPKIKGVNGWELDMSVLLSKLGVALLPGALAAKLEAKKPLNEAETALVQNAPETARSLILNIPRLEPVADAIFYQNKGYDGSGFPESGPVGDEIPLTARVLKILLDLSAATALRIPGREVFDALEKRGREYDPKILAGIRSALLAVKQEDSEGTEDVRVQMLNPGDELITDIRTVEGQLLLAAGNELTEAMVKKIGQFHKLQGVKEPISIRRAA